MMLLELLFAKRYSNQPYRRIQLKVRNRMERSYSEHEAIISAIRSGDHAAAADAMRNHVLVQGDRFHEP